MEFLAPKAYRAWRVAWVRPEILGKLALWAGQDGEAFRATQARQARQALWAQRAHLAGLAMQDALARQVFRGEPVSMAAMERATRDDQAHRAHQVSMVAQDDEAKQDGLATVVWMVRQVLKESPGVLEGMVELCGEDQDLMDCQDHRAVQAPLALPAT
mmetsp:Transcript_27836/g.64197  ORF Transcript_27836/g.64197 Transcript_27836/m.64197 type:complete len:158 (+) Transcript_27836:526-999(+)